MRKFIIRFLILSVLGSCEQATINNKLKVSSDTLVKNDQDEIDLKKLRKEYILAYNKPIEFESYHKGKNGEKIKVYGKYYCLFDNGIVVPKKYNLDDTTKTFTTHNFAEDIAVMVNGDTVFKKTITKKIFADNLPNYLKDYAVILEPTFEGYDSDGDIFGFNFSISIPLTDVGEPRLLSIKKNGQMTVHSGE